MNAETLPVIAGAVAGIALTVIILACFFSGICEPVPEEPSQFIPTYDRPSKVIKYAEELTFANRRAVNLRDQDGERGAYPGDLESAEAEVQRLAARLQVVEKA